MSLQLVCDVCAKVIGNGRHWALSPRPVEPFGDDDSHACSAECLVYLAAQVADRVTA